MCSSDLHDLVKMRVESSTLLQVLSTKKAIFKRPQNYYNHYGQLIETINTTIPLLYKGELLGAIEIAKDIKHIKQLSEKLLELENLHRTMTSPRQKQNSNKNTPRLVESILKEELFSKNQPIIFSSATLSHSQVQWKPS